MSKRPADKVLSREGEKVVLGGETFEVKPLVIKHARQFRGKIMEAIARAGQLENAGDINGIVDTITSFFDEDIIELVKMAIPEFANKKTEWIEENVTEAELQEVMGVAVQVNFPWISKMASLGKMGTIMNKAKQK